MITLHVGDKSISKHIDFSTVVYVKIFIYREFLNITATFNSIKNITKGISELTLTHFNLSILQCCTIYMKKIQIYEGISEKERTSP